MCNKWKYWLIVNQIFAVRPVNGSDRIDSVKLFVVQVAAKEIQESTLAKLVDQDEFWFRQQVLGIDVYSAVAYFVPDGEERASDTIMLFIAHSFTFSSRYVFRSKVVRGSNRG